MMSFKMNNIELDFDRWCDLNRKLYVILNIYYIHKNAPLKFLTTNYIHEEIKLW